MGTTKKLAKIHTKLVFHIKNNITGKTPSVAHIVGVTYSLDIFFTRLFVPFLRGRDPERVGVLKPTALWAPPFKREEFCALSIHFPKYTIPTIAEKLNKNPTSYAKKYGLINNILTKAIHMALHIFISLHQNSASIPSHHIIVALNTELSIPHIIA